MKKLSDALFLDVNTLVNENALPELVPDILAINNSIYNILSTPIGSRTFQPEYGSRLEEFIHEPIDGITAFEIGISLIQSIQRWEPRITIDRQRTNVEPTSYGFNVTIAYSIPRLKKDSSITIQARR